MPDYSILSETELTLLLEYALLDYWDEHFDIDKISNLKMHKIMYEVSEEENLPITRSWYILGNNIHEREIVRRNFGWEMLGDPENVVLQDGSVFNIIDLIDTYSEIYQVFGECISSIISKTGIVFSSQDEYLRQLYSEKAPKKFSEAYSASLEYRIYLGRLEKLVRFYDPEKLKNGCMDRTTTLHKSISNVREFRKLFELLFEYTNTIEDAVLKNATIGKNTRLDDTQLNFFSGQNEFYLQNVWKPFAKIIAINTVKGPRKEQIIDEYSNDLRDISEFYANIQSNSKIARDLKLFLTKQEFKTEFIDKKDQLDKIIEAGDLLQRG